MRASLYYLAGLCAFAAIVIWQRQIESLPTLAYQILMPLPLVLTPLAMVVALLLRQSRVFFILLILLALYQYGLPAYASAKRELMVDMISMVVPLIMAVLSLSADRGVLSRFGLTRLVALLLVIILCNWLLVSQPAWLLGVFEWTLIPGLWPLEHWSQPGLVVIGLVFVLLLRQARQGSQGDSHLFILLLAGLIVSIEFLTNQLAIAVAFTAMVVFALLATAMNLLQKAYHDELTGLPGRRALREQMLRVAGGYVVAMLDVDHFKKFNDTYGHDVGDQVLKFVAEKMRKVGAGGKAFRYGGEEFTFVFPGRSREEAAVALEAVREDIARSRFGMRKKGLSRRKDEKRGQGAGKYVGVTVSIGASEANTRNETYEQAIKQADRALYDAKEAGRNNLQWK